MGNYLLEIIFLIVILLYMLVLSVSKYKKWKHREVSCSKCVTAIVIDVQKKKTRRGGIGYKPIFQVNEENRVVNIESAMYSSVALFEKGQTVILLVNPDDYQEYLYEEESYNKGKQADLIACIMPLFLIIATIAIIYKK